jgi:hypothetical protein
MGWTARVRFPARARDLLFSTESRPVLEPTQVPIQCATGALSPIIKRPGNETIKSPPSADVKNSGAIPAFPIHLHGMALIN